MSDVITAFQSLFDFLIDGLGDIAEFFTTTTLGFIILGVAVFGIVAEFVSAFVNKLHK